MDQMLQKDEGKSDGEDVVKNVEVKSLQLYLQKFGYYKGSIGMQPA